MAARTRTRTRCSFPAASAILDRTGADRGGRVYDFRAQGIGHDADGRPDLAPPSWLLTAGRGGPVPLGVRRRAGCSTGCPAPGARPRARPAGAGAARLRRHRPGHRAAARAPRPARLDDVRLGGRPQPRADRRGARRRAGPLRRGVRRASGRPVDVVGWSFGGLLARWVAHERPTQVRSVVTLGSPWRPEGERTRTTPLFERSRRTHGLSERAEKVVDELRGPLPVPDHRDLVEDRRHRRLARLPGRRDRGSRPPATWPCRAATSAWPRTRSRSPR